MKKVLFGLAVLMMATNAHALNASCADIGKIQPLMNEVHDYMISFPSANAKKREEEFKVLSDKANELYADVNHCGDTYSVNLAEQILDAVGQIGEHVSPMNPKI